MEEATRSSRGLKYAVCLGGQNACPPEDSGGVWGYAELLEVLADPDHDEHDPFTRWVGGPFDPSSFDLVGVNACLQQLR